MPESHKDLYAASCNPPRRAKRPSIPTTDDVASSEPPAQPHRAILPMRAYAPRPITTATEPTVAPPPPAKRGRKPGPLSRSAREAQRRLNHSIIEKARRTKINDALATLKQLVPANYGQQKQVSADSPDEDEDEDDDGDYQEGTKKTKPKSKGTGKKEEKEKEFKLEILIRTVSFLQDLLERVAVLESKPAPSSTCRNCGAGQEPKKRKHIHLEEDDRPDAHHTDIPARNAKIPRHSENSPDSAIKKTLDMAPVAVPISVPQTSALPPSPNLDVASSGRLPSISSWLHTSNAVIDPQLLSGAAQAPPPRSSPPMGSYSYLPSPPSSTHFDPVRGSTVPPVLHLGPVATAAMVAPGNPSRSPEDESAASLLLQISASSPTFCPVSSSSSSSNYGLLDPSGFSLHSDLRSQREGHGHVRQAQTPSSLLGLNPASKNLKH